MDPDEIREFLTGAHETLEKIESTLNRLNETPNTAPTIVPVQQTQGVPEQATVAQSHGWLSRRDILEVRSELRKKSIPELHALIGMQASRRDQGVPFDVWAAAGGQPLAQAIQSNPMLMKAIDTGGAAALIRQDLEPVLYELYVREFPAWERFPKEPANGLVHAYNQITSFGGAEFMPELGTVTDDQSVYARKTTNVAIVATRRGISLKSQFAVQAGGMGYNPEQLELQGGLRAIAKKMQDTIFGGQSTDSGGTLANELGLYDANGFDGLRSILNTGRVKNVDPTLATPEDMRAKIDEACVEIMQQGGRASIIWAEPTEKTTFDLQQDKNIRYMDQRVEVAVGILTNAVNTVFGPLPIAVVPGNSIHSYTYGQDTVRDMYILDESTISMPFLGTDGPTVLDIPIGISGQLTHLYILFGMWGLAVKAIPFSNKVRVTLP
jgi:hypothetical protein